MGCAYGAVDDPDARTSRVEAVLNTGPRTNHPNFVTVGGVNYAYLTVGDLNQTLVYRCSTNGGPPTLVKRIQDHGDGPHGIWPSPDNTRIYVALQYSDAMDVIDTRTMNVIRTLRIGQSPMALVHVARTSAGSAANLSRQGLGKRIEDFPVEVQGIMGAGPAESPRSAPFPESMRSTWTHGGFPPTVRSPCTPPAATRPRR